MKVQNWMLRYKWSEFKPFNIQGFKDTSINLARWYIPTISIQCAKIYMTPILTKIVLIINTIQAKLKQIHSPIWSYVELSDFPTRLHGSWTTITLGFDIWRSNEVRSMSINLQLQDSGEIIFREYIPGWVRSHIGRVNIHSLLNNDERSVSVLWDNDLHQISSRAPCLKLFESILTHFAMWWVLQRFRIFVGTTKLSWWGVLQ